MTKVKPPAFLTDESEDRRNSPLAMPAAFPQSTLGTPGTGLVCLTVIGHGLGMVLSEHHHLEHGTLSWFLSSDLKVCRIQLWEWSLDLGPVK